MTMSKPCSVFIFFMHNALINGSNEHYYALTAKKRSIYGAATTLYRLRDLDLAWSVIIITSAHDVIFNCLSFHIIRIKPQLTLFNLTIISYQFIIILNCQKYYIKFIYSAFQLLKQQIQ